MGNRKRGERIAAELIAMLFDGNVNQVTKEMVRAWFWSRVSSDAKDAALIERFRNLAPNLRPGAEDFREFVELAARLDIDGVELLLIPKRRLPRFLGIAASLLLFFCASGAVYIWADRAGYFTKQLTAHHVTVTAGYPEHAISLPDGSTVTLGRDATISYDDKFTGGREITLSGQALFDVAEAEDEDGRRRPFTVQTGDLHISVLGTVFNVETQTGSDTSRVALYEGEVYITHGEGGASLHPGEALAFDNQTRSHTVSLVPAEEMIRHGFKPLLRFDRSDLSGLILSLEANFGVRFVVPPHIDMAGEAISADLEGLPLDEIVAILSITDKHHSYRLNGDTITITNKKTILDE